MNNCTNEYFGVGIFNPKNQLNVGTLWRTASILKAAFMFTIGQRIKKQASDTYQSYKSIPLYNYPTFEDFYKNMPYSCRLVGVELSDKSIPIESYQHLDRAVYLLGAEDNGIPDSILSKCYQVIQLPLGNYNVSTAGSIVLYDRFIKGKKVKFKD